MVEDKKANTEDEGNADDHSDTNEQQKKLDGSYKKEKNQNKQGTENYTQYETIRKKLRIIRKKLMTKAKWEGWDEEKETEEGKTRTVLMRKVIDKKGRA